MIGSTIVNQRQNSPIYPIALVTAVMLGVFALDIATPLGIASGVLYVIAVLASSIYPGIRLLTITAVTSSLLILLGLYLAPAGTDVWKTNINRLISLVVVCCTALFIGMLKSKFIDSQKEKNKQRLMVAFFKRYVLPSAVAVIALCFLYLGLGHVKQRILSVHENSLKTISHSMYNSIRDVWLSDILKNLNAQATNPEIIQLAQELLGLEETPQTLIKSEAQERLRKRLEVMIEESQARGFFLISPKGISVGSMRDENLGKLNLIAELEQARFHKVISGSWAFIPPIPSDVPLRNLNGLLIDNYPTMFVAVPIRNAAYMPIAVLAVRLDPFDSLYELLNSINDEEGEEVYLLDKNRRISSESHGISSLRDHHGEIKLRSDEINPIWNGTQYQGNGSTSTPYLNYKRKKVIGAWIWDPEMQLAFVVEMEEKKALEAFDDIAFIIILVFFSVLVVTILSYLALVRLTQSIDDKIEQSEAMLDSTLNGVLDAILTIDENGIIQRVNNSTLSMFGYSNTQLLGSNINMLMPEEVATNHDDYIKTYLQTREPKVIGIGREVVARKSDGTYFFARLGISEVEVDGKRYFTGVLHDMTLEKKLIEELEYNNWIFKESEHIALLGGWEWSESDSQFIMTKGAREIFGLDGSKSNLVSKEDFLSRVYSDDRARFTQFINRPSDNSNSIEFKVLDSSLGCKYIVARKKSRPVTENDSRNVFGIFQDISSQVLAQQELKKMENSLLEAQTLAQLGSWELTVSNMKMLWSRELYKLLDIEIDKTPEFADFCSRIHPKDRERVINAVQRTIIFQDSFHEEFRVLLAGNIEKMFLGKGYASKANETLVVYGTAQDVTEIKKNELKIREIKKELEVLVSQQTDELERSDALVKQLLTSAGEGICGLDPSGRITFVNPAAAEMLGYHPNELIGKSMHRELHHSYPDGSPYPIESSNILKAYHTKCIQRVDSEVLWHKDLSSIPVEYTSTPIIKDGLAVGAVVTFRDIRERKAFEDALLLARDEADRANHVKSEFLAKMSHELRTPINGVLGMLSLLSKTSLTQAQMKKLAIAQESGKTLLAMVNDVLDFSKIEAKKVEIESIDFNLLQLIEDVCHAHAVRAIEKGLNFYIDASEITVDTVRGDPTKLRQVLSNLISNAVKFTEIGSIQVIVKFTKDKNDTDYNLTCQVIDTGIGMRKEKLPLLFNSFQQIDGTMTRKYGGTGLGLAIIKPLIEMMNGEIYVNSKLGAGSTFKFTLDFEKSHSEAEYVDQFDGNMFLSLLLIKDEKCEEILLRIFESLDIKTLTFSSCGSLENYLREYHLENELVVFVCNECVEDSGDMIQYMMRDLKRPGIRFVTLAPLAIANEFLQTLASKQICLPITKSEVIDVFRDNERSLSLSNEDSFEKVLDTMDSARILLAEDNKINQQVIIGFLEDTPFQCDVVDNGMEVLKKLSSDSNNSAYELILMDCQMPELDGFQTTEKIRNGICGPYYTNIPIIAITANAMKGDRQRCLNFGMNDYLSKPIDPDLLYKTLAEWLGSPSSKSVKLMENIHTQSVEGDLNNLMIWNKKAFLKRLRNKKQLCKKIISLYREGLDDRIDAIGGAIANSQVDDIVSAAHELKGVSGNIGAEKLYHCCQVLENKAKNEATNIEFDLMMNVLRQESERLLDVLNIE
ncbi:MAG: PAS domain S-box protein [Pseudomonadales bacterium]|nr:PAS domain S-box protein [Pseudomonadales bacterium]